MVSSHASESSLLSKSFLFYGSPDSPFLAPRGVWMTHDALFVSDTGQNRVFIWRSRPDSPRVAPDVVLGQETADQTHRNAGKEVHAGSLQYPSGIWSDGKRLMVADAWNHRVLIWNQLPTRHGQPADLILGQPDERANEPNVAGVSAAPSAQSMYWPYGLHSDGSQLWVADTGNRRVLYYRQIPTHSYAPADAVIGQPGFDSRDYDPRFPVWPYSVRVSAAGELAITDTQYFRVMLWRQWEDALHKSPHALIGQPSLDSNGQNQYQLKPSARTLNWCYDAFFYQHGLWVADTGNSRLLRFDEFPTKHNPPAQGLIGHKDFETGSENVDTIMGTENSLYWPFSICIYANSIVIADTGNHRLIFNNLSNF